MANSPKESISTLLLSKVVFCIPSYQREYAWEKKQVTDLIEDVDAVVQEGVRSHYMGTVVRYLRKNDEPLRLDNESYAKEEIVDGQQRLTTIILYVAILYRLIMDKTIDDEERSSFDRQRHKYVIVGNRAKLLRDDNSNNINAFYLDLIKNGGELKGGDIKLTSSQRERLYNAAQLLREHVAGLPVRSVVANTLSLESIKDAILDRMFFTSYDVEDETEIGMTFELMNARGKDLTDLEKLKNYFMYWIGRNCEQNRKDELKEKINASWGDVYRSVHGARGDENRCLRIAWTLCCDGNYKEWGSYDGFKHPRHFPIRNFPENNPKMAIEVKLERFVDDLCVIARHYADVVCPSKIERPILDEKEWLTCIQNTGASSNLIPLIVAARVGVERNLYTDSAYLELLKAVENFIYRVTLYAGARSNAARSYMYGAAYRVFNGGDLQRTISDIYLRAEGYCSRTNVESMMKTPESSWYNPSRPMCLRYTLFEYEKYCVKVRGLRMRIDWQNTVGTSSIEHVLPQHPSEEPESEKSWLAIWSDEDRNAWTGDIGNLVLTRNNSNYRNFDFDRKKNGKNGDGTGDCYRRSLIAQEQDIAGYDVWDVKSVADRHEKLYAWILARWFPKQQYDATVKIDALINEDSVEDGEE